MIFISIYPYASGTADSELGFNELKTFRGSLIAGSMATSIDGLIMNHVAKISSNFLSILQAWQFHHARYPIGGFVNTSSAFQAYTHYSS